MSTVKENTRHLEVFMLFLSLGYGADLGRSRHGFSMRRSGGVGAYFSEEFEDYLILTLNETESFGFQRFQHRHIKRRNKSMRLQTATQSSQDRNKKNFMPTWLRPTSETCIDHLTTTKE